MIFKKENFGLVENTFDPNDVWEDEVLGGEDITLPKEYRISGLTYEYQSVYPFCVSFAGTTMLEYKYREKGKQSYSQPHLFFNSGGSKYGSTFRGNLNTLKNHGAIPYEKFPMPSLEPYKKGDWLTVLTTKGKSIPFNDAKKLTGYVRIDAWDTMKLRQAIVKYGPIMVGMYAGGTDYYTNAWHKRYKSPDNHCVALVGWTEDGRWITFDSLGYVRNGKKWGGTPLEAGYRTVSPSYSFKSAYAITELPKNWKKKRDKVRSEGFDHVLNHYGKPRDFEAEQRNGIKMLDEFNKFNNKSVTDASGKFWTVLVNAVTYGGYSISYRKYGRWQPGDVINSVYNWRRTGEHIFDFNKLRSEHK